MQYMKGDFVICDSKVMLNFLLCFFFKENFKLISIYGNSILTDCKYMIYIDVQLNPFLSVALWLILLHYVLTH